MESPKKGTYLALAEYLDGVRLDLREQCVQAVREALQKAGGLELKLRGNEWLETEFDKVRWESDSDTPVFITKKGHIFDVYELEESELITAVGCLPESN